MGKLTISLIDHNQSDFEPELKKYCNRTGETISRAHLYGLLDKNWFLFAKHGDLSQGWVIVSNNQNQLSRERFIRVEMAYSETDYNSMTSIENDLNQLAKDVGASFIEMGTAFSKIAEHAQKHGGYEISRYVCRKQVT